MMRTCRRVSFLTCCIRGGKIDSAQAVCEIMCFQYVGCHTRCGVGAFGDFVLLVVMCPFGKCVLREP